MVKQLHTLFDMCQLRWYYKPDIFCGERAVISFSAELITGVGINHASARYSLTIWLKLQ